MQTAAGSVQNELVINDLQKDALFVQRKLHTRDLAAQIEALQGLSLMLSGAPETVLQGLVNAAIDICGADSAGVSLESEDATDEAFYKWIATAGEYAKYLDAMLPRIPSACGICLERDRPQLFKVSQRFLDQFGGGAAEITDGILLPWHAGETKGTIWILAHGRREAFDYEDYRIMQLLAGFAAVGVRQKQQHIAELSKARAEGGAVMAVEVAQKLKGPLQTTKAIAYLAERSRTSVEAKLLAEEMSLHLEELSSLVKGLKRPQSRKNSRN